MYYMSFMDSDVIKDVIQDIFVTVPVTPVTLMTGKP